MLPPFNTRGGLVFEGNSFGKQLVCDDMGVDMIYSLLLLITSMRFGGNEMAGYSAACRHSEGNMRLRAESIAS
jgi:hypothetical protein